MNNNLFQVVTVPLKKLANLLFSLIIPLKDSSSSTLASLIIVGVLLTVIIGVITHSSAPRGGIGGIISKIKDHKK